MGQWLWLLWGISTKNDLISRRDLFADMKREKGRRKRRRRRTTTIKCKL